MASASKSARELARLRGLVRDIVLEQGTAIAPTANLHEPIDALISDVVARRHPTFREDSDHVLEQIEDRDAHRTISDYFGDIMAAYGDAGFFVGVAVGLELATLTQPIARVAGAGSRPKGATR